MSLLARFRRKKEDPEAARRGILRRSGRLGDAIVQDVRKDGSGITVSYLYNIGGAEYESSQSIDPAQSQREQDCLPGRRIAIRYDPHRPANSVVV